jgi:hypothetical protein
LRGFLNGTFDPCLFETTLLAAIIHCYQSY